MTPVCDNKSVGVIIKNLSGAVLLIERARFPLAIAPPAGHIDEHGSSLKTAVNEVFEEVGVSLEAENLRMVLSDLTIQNKCRRGGDYHIWDVYEVTVDSDSFVASKDETNGARWYDKPELRDLIAQTRLASQPNNQVDLLEPVWLQFFEEYGF